MQLSLDGRRPLTADLVADLAAFTDRVEASGAAAVLELTGVPAEVAEPATGLVNKWERVLRRFERLTAPTIAVVHGDCGGVAVEALLATDLRIADRHTRLHLPSVWPGMLLHRLGNQIGAAAVRRYVLFGGVLTAADAHALHLLHEVTDDRAAALEAAGDLVAGLSGDDLAVRRQLLLEATTTPFEEALGRHLAACDRLSRRPALAEVPDGPALV